MRILDRERYWSFIKSYAICFVSLVGLWVVIDAFSNFDEFAKRAAGWQVFAIMGRFYLVRITQYYDRLCGVISMMAAIFTVTMMQRNNELLAMLAAGISTQRVIRPVLVAAVLVNGLAVANQEFMIPPLAEELQKSHDDDGTRRVRVVSRLDSKGILVQGLDGDRGSRTVAHMNVTIPSEFFGGLVEIESRAATYIPETVMRTPMRGGWLLRGAKLDVAMDPRALRGGALVQLDTCAGFPPVPPIGDPKEMALLDCEAYFIRTEVDFETLVGVERTADPARNRVPVPAAGKLDRNGILLHGNDGAGSHALRNARTAFMFYAIFPDAMFGGPREVEARQATYIPPDDKESPMRGGWLLRGARFNLPIDAARAKETPLAVLDSTDGYPPPAGDDPLLVSNAFFLHTDLSFQAMTRRPDWYQYANTRDLIVGLYDPVNRSESRSIEVFLHGRLLRPFLGITLMCVSLPLVLTGYNKNMFFSLGVSLGVSGLFYAVTFLGQYLGGSADLTPTLGAWLPMFLFATIAVARWDTIRT